MTALKNLTSLKRTITKRVHEALQELQETLGNLGGSLERAPAPSRVPVPVRGPGPFRNPMPRGLYWASGKFREKYARASQGATFTKWGRYSQYPSARFFSTYSKLGGFDSWRWARINQSVMFHNFSSKSQFRSKSFHRFYSTPTLTQLLKKKLGIYDEKQALDLGPSHGARLARRGAVPIKLRLDFSLTQKYHDVVLDLAKAPYSTSSGCYLDFKINPQILVPATTIMSADVLAELLVNLKRFEHQVADLQQDLLRLSELGELPLKFIAAENVIRVFFPNCDRAQLEQLLMEKNIAGGVIHEDIPNNIEHIENDDQFVAISEFDILSNCKSILSSSSSSVSDDNDYDDILSSSVTSSKYGKTVHVEPVTVSSHVDIVDDYYWA